MKKKKVRIILLIGVALFLGYNILWFFGRFFPYEKLYLMLLEEDSGSGVFLDGDYYAYWVKRPTYLRWMDGNIAVVNNQEARKGYDGNDPDNGDSIIIWLNPFTMEVGNKDKVV